MNDVSVSADLTGLPSHSIYHYRIVATNTFGTLTGSDKTFNTATSSSDFNGDGQTDLLWMNKTTGEVDVWLYDRGNSTMVVGRSLSRQIPCLSIGRL